MHAEKTYESSSADPEVERARYDDFIHREFYRGFSRMAARPGFAIRAEERLSVPIQICSLSLKGIKAEFYRRSRDLGDVDLDVLWLLRHGRLSLNQDGFSACASTGQCILSHSRSPFSMLQTGDQSGRFDAVIVIMPHSMLRSLAPELARPAIAVSINGAIGDFANRSFDLLLEYGSQLPQSILQSAAASALSAFERCFMLSPHRRSGRFTHSGAKWSRVVELISATYADPDLSLGTIAKHCGISTRRLCGLAEEQGTTVSDVLWDTRLARANELLSASCRERGAVAEIARRTGFKTLAHFSRRYKQKFGSAPSTQLDVELRGAS